MRRDSQMKTALALHRVAANELWFAGSKKFGAGMAPACNLRGYVSWPFRGGICQQEIRAAQQHGGADRGAIVPGYIVAILSSARVGAGADRSWQHALHASRPLLLSLVAQPADVRGMGYCVRGDLLFCSAILAGHGRDLDWSGESLGARLDYAPARHAALSGQRAFRLGIMEFDPGNDGRGTGNVRSGCVAVRAH